MTLVLQIAAGIILAVGVLNLWSRFQSRRLEAADQAWGAEALARFGYLLAQYMEC